MHGNGFRYWLQCSLFLPIISACGVSGPAVGQDQPPAAKPGVSIAPASVWRYVTSGSTDAFPDAPFVSIPLTETRPALLTQDVPRPDGAKRSYGLIRFGSAQSIQIAMLVDDYGGGRFDLYVNADRDSEITADELVSGTGNTRTTTLACEIAYAEPSLAASDQPAAAGALPAAVAGANSGAKPGPARTKHVDRVVTLKRGLIGRSLTMVTRGYLEGKVKLQDIEVAARRMDGDGNGQFADPRDRLWLDLNRDGKWEAFTEQFAFQPLLQLQGQRYAIKTDQAGEGLWCEPITGEGRVRFAISGLAAGTILKEIEISVVGRDGSLYAARAVDEPVVLPIGDYSLSLVRVTVGDKDDSASQWEYVFSKIGLGPDAVWHTVKKDQTLVIDPVGKMSLTMERDGKDDPVPLGRDLHLRPILVTQDGLIINSAKQLHGTASHELHLSIQLCRADKSWIQETTSGFA